METYWPEHKVHLHIMLALFPTRLKNTELSVQQLDRYFHAGSPEQLILHLRDYSRLDYFKFTVSISLEYEKHAQAHRDLLLKRDNPNFTPAKIGYTDGLEGPHIKCGVPLSEKELLGMFGVLKQLSTEQLKQYLRFTLTRIDTEKVIKKLAEYSNSLPHQLPSTERSAQNKHLQQAMSRQYLHRRYQPVITPVDIGGDKAVAISPFWEPILSLYFANKIEFEDIGYREVSAEHGEAISQPYAQLRVKDKKLQELLKSDKGSAYRSKKGPFERVEYNGLIFDGTNITYGNTTIYLPFQERQLLRFFIENKEKCIPSYEFTKNGDIFPRDSYKDKNATLSKLIHKLNNKLRAAVGKGCITKTPLEGWALKIE